MIIITNITGRGTQTKTYERLLCSPVWVGELKQQSISFSAINILFSVTAILGNSLILVALNKESSLHSPSKLLYRCLATTDLLVGLVTQPLCATYWMSSRHVVEIQRDCNFKAHVYHFSYILGCMSSRWFILSFRLPYNLLVRLYSYIILPDYLYRLVHKNFPRYQSLSSSSTRSCSTTAEPTKCTEHGAIQKGSVQCAVGAVSSSCLLCTTIYTENCDVS